MCERCEENKKNGEPDASFQWSDVTLQLGKHGFDEKAEKIDKSHLKALRGAWKVLMGKEWWVDWMPLKKTTEVFILFYMTVDGETTSHPIPMPIPKVCTVEEFFRRLKILLGQMSAMSTMDHIKDEVMGMLNMSVNDSQEDFEA